MSIALSRSSVGSSCGNLDPMLLNRAQAFLRCRRQGRVPSAPLRLAWERFYCICDPCIRRLATACGAPLQDLNDCAQEVWTTLLAKLCDFDYNPERARFSSWLYPLVQSRAIDLLRRQIRQRAVNLTPASEQRLLGSELDPAAVYERRCRRALVHLVLRELRKRVPERSYRVLYMRWIEGRTLPEIAATLNLRPNQVSLCHHRAKQKFRQLYERHAEASLPYTYI